MTEMCVVYASEISIKLENPSAHDIQFCEWLVSALEKAIGGDPPCKKNLWSEFHQTRSTTEFSMAWKKFMHQCDLEDEPAFYQHVTFELFEELLSRKIAGKETESSAQTDISLTFEEQNAIRYMSGYVLRKVCANHNVDFLLKTTCANEAATDSSAWINTIDRGGLVHVTDDCFQLFLSMESAIRRKLDEKKMTDGFCQSAETALRSDDSVLFDWLMITGDEEEQQEILFALIKYWVNIRGHAFAKSILEKYKNDNKKSTNKSKGLRTKLFTDQLL